MTLDDLGKIELSKITRLPWTAVCRRNVMYVTSPDKLRVVTKTRSQWDTEDYVDVHYIATACTAFPMLVAALLAIQEGFDKPQNYRMIDDAFIMLDKQLGTIK